MSQAEEPPYPSGRYAAYVVLVLLLAFFMSFLDRQILTLLLPSLKADLGVTDTQVSLIQGMAFVSIYALAGLSMGWVADHTNRRNMIVAGITFWSLATAACGLAESFWQLCAARMAVGLGEACLAPACISIMADYFRPAQRGRAVGVMMMGTSAGAAGSLFLGGLLLTSLTHGDAAALVPQGWAPWRMVFVLVAGPGLLVAILAGTLKEPPRRDVLPAADRPDAELRLIDFFREHPGTMARLFGLVACAAVAAYSVTSWAPTMLMRVYGMAPTKAGVIYGSIMLFCAATAGVVSGFTSDALVRRWRFGGRALIPAFLLPLEFATDIAMTVTNSAPVVVAALALSAFNFGCIGSSYQPAIQDLFPNQLRGRAVAFLGLVGTVVGLGAGPTLVALVTDRVFHDDMMLQRSMGLVALAMTTVALLLAVGLPPRYAQSRRKVLSAKQQPASPTAT